jgi:hypothetical protein
VRRRLFGVLIEPAGFGRKVGSGRTGLVAFLCPLPVSRRLSCVDARLLGVFGGGVMVAVVMRFGRAPVRLLGGLVLVGRAVVMLVRWMLRHLRLDE